mmetsp:Transcript_45793/g.178117  ORF Transcript_45793/g.178117 Transcript_45793/m.178117 type:complete len:89 (-) Transcript_45793:755-1021(-)
MILQQQVRYKLLLDVYTITPVEDVLHPYEALFSMLHRPPEMLLQSLGPVSKLPCTFHKEYRRQQQGNPRHATPEDSKLQETEPNCIWR